MITTILLVFALVLFILAGVGIGGKYNLVALGLACWVASVLFGSGFPK